MVGVFSFGELPRRMDKLGGTITHGVSTLVQEVAIGIGATVVDTTRVDTGKARSNWRATLDTPANGVIPPYSPGNNLGIGETANANAAKAQQKQVIRRFSAVKQRSIFITNRVPYIETLNSKGTAPGMMIEQGIQTGRLVLSANASKVLKAR